METHDKVASLIEKYTDGSIDLNEFIDSLDLRDDKRSLGQLIGKAVDNFAITNDEGDKVQLKLTFDYSTATNIDIKSWLNGNRRIALQRPARAMDKNELKALDNTTVIAIDAGKKVKTKAERIKEAQATIAALKANYPEEYDNLVDEMNVEHDTDSEDNIINTANSEEE